MSILVRPDGPIPARAAIIFNRCIRQGSCLIWQGSSCRGHGNLHGKRYPHVEVFEAYNGPVPTGLEVGHSCDNGLCCEPTHLEAITRQKNVQDAFLRKRYSRGRYTNEEVHALRTGTISVRDFATRYGLKRKTVYNIKLGHKAKWR